MREICTQLHAQFVNTISLFCQYEVRAYSLILDSDNWGKEDESAL